MVEDLKMQNFILLVILSCKWRVAGVVMTTCNVTSDKIGEYSNHCVFWQVKIYSKWYPGKSNNSFAVSSMPPGCLENYTLRWRHNGCDGVSNHQPHHCLLNRVFRRRSKKTSKLRITGLCAGNSPGTGEFPTQMASSAENFSIWWCHHEEQWCLGSGDQV